MIGSINSKKTTINAMMKEWLESIFVVGYEKWQEIQSVNYPYSNITILQQFEVLEIPQKIVIKKANPENNFDISTSNIKVESAALRRLKEISGIQEVRTPEIYGVNEKLCCIAMEHVDGQRIINYLLEFPLKTLLGKIEIEKYQEKMYNLGKWLKAMHSEITPNIIDEKELERSLKRDKEGIEKRVNYLGEIRNKDFPEKTGDEIISRVTSLIKKMVEKPPALKAVHGDFSLVNILLQPPKIYVVDFTSFGPGLPEDDLARIYLDFKNIDEYTFRLRPKKKGSFTWPFFEGYGGKIEIRNPYTQFYLIKHALINLYMYRVNMGRENFLNPLLCRVLYSTQKSFLKKMMNDQVYEWMKN